MASAPRPALLSEKGGVVLCHLGFPLAGLARVAAEAVSFDRRGAVVRLSGAGVALDAVRTQDAVVIDLALPGNPNYGKRVLHFLGKVTLVSRQRSGQVWLAIAFTHVSIASLSQPSAIGPWTGAKL